MRDELRRFRWLVIPATALITVAAGIAINEAFVLGRGLLWPWFLAAVLLSAVQIWASRQPDELNRSHKSAVTPTPDAPTTVSEERSRELLAGRLHNLATYHIPARAMSIAWTVEKSDYDPKASNELRISGSSAITEYFLETSYQRLVILGEPGSGKSVLAWRIALDIVDQQRTGGRFPIVLGIGSWNPFEEYFESWLRRKLADTNNELNLNIDISTVLPILDGLDEYSDQLMAQALTVLSRGEALTLPLILVSRSNRYQYSSLWRYFLGNAAIVQLKPLPTDQIIEYLELLPRGDHGSPLDAVVRELLGGTNENVAKVLCSAFMLRIAGDEFMNRDPYRFIAITRRGTSTNAEEFLADCFIRRRLNDNLPWTKIDAAKWLAEVAHRSDTSFAFRPNNLTIPVFIFLARATLFAVFSTAGILLTVDKLPILIAPALVVAYGICPFIISVLSDNDPTLDPQRQFRIKRANAFGLIILVFSPTLLYGLVYLVIPYTGLWIFGLVLILGLSTGVPAGAAWSSVLVTAQQPLFSS